MRDLTKLPTVTPDQLLSSDPLPPPAGPVRFTFGAAPERDKAAMLQESFARIGFAYEIDRLPDVPLVVDVAMNALPGLVIGEGKIHGSRNKRTRALVEDGTDDVGLIVNLKGPHRIVQGKHELVLGDGEAVFMSCSDPCEYWHRPPGDIIALRFPRERFGPLVSRMHDRYMQKIPRDAPALKFLTSYLSLAWDEKATTAPELQHLLVNHVYDLMAVMVGATRDAQEEAQGRGLRAARLHAIKQDIAASLDRPDLSVAALAARHHCTPRFMQRLFEGEGTTFTDYVLAQRLARAHRMLSDPLRKPEKISALALDCGFGDVSYFNRAFRRHYGAAPSDVRAQARGNGHANGHADGHANGHANGNGRPSIEDWSI